LRYQPGTKLLCSLRANIAGRLVEVLSGMAFDEYLKEKLFGPLGMVAAEFRCPLKMFSCRIGHAFVLLR